MVRLSTRMHTGGMLTGERDVIIVLGSISGTAEDELLPLNLDITGDRGCGSDRRRKPQR